MRMQKTKQVVKTAKTVQKCNGLQVRTRIKAGSGFWDDMRALYNLPPADKKAP